MPTEIWFNVLNVVTINMDYIAPLMPIALSRLLVSLLASWGECNLCYLFFLFLHHLEDFRCKFTYNRSFLKTSFKSMNSRFSFRTDYANLYNLISIMLNYGLLCEIQEIWFIILSPQYRYILLTSCPWKRHNWMALQLNRQENFG